MVINVSHGSTEGVDAGGDIQKIKEELEKVNVDLAAIEVLNTAIKVATEAASGAAILQSAFLTVTTSAQTSTLAAPGEGHHFEVYGYQLVYAFLNTSAITHAAKLAMNTVMLWSGGMPNPTIGIDGTHGLSHATSISGIRVAGANNTAITLTNYTENSGNKQEIYVVIFYKDITD